MKIALRLPSLFIVFLFLPLFSLGAQQLLQKINEAEELTLADFLTAAGKNTFFEEILIDTLTMQYAEVLALPAEDLILSVKSAYRVRFPSENSNQPTHGFDGSLGLSKLFADSGTTLSAALSTSPGSGNSDSSRFTLEIAQPIARNAFGKSNRATRKLTQIENRILEMQIVEAYEDYYAELITLYYTWHAEYAALLTSQNSYSTSRALIAEMESKFDYGIANRLDLDKSNIQFYSKWDSLIQQERAFKETTDLIRQAIREEDTQKLFRPVLEDYQGIEEEDFDACYETFRTSARTYEVFDLLEEKSALSMALKADELLPSANLYASYDLEGKGTFFKNGIGAQSLQIGIDLDYPIPSSQARASYESEKIAHRKTALSNSNKKIELKTQLLSLFRQIESDKERIALADSRVETARRIAESETKDYNLGKSDLNDLISALNQVDSMAQTRINTIVRQNQNRVELLRFTDRLIAEESLWNEATAADSQTEAVAAESESA